MRFENDGSGAGLGPFADLFQLQSDFQRRMAEETLKYLRQLHGMVGPVVPGTVVSPTAEALSARAVPGGTARLEFDVDNRQRVHCMVTPMLGPLVNPAGVTWFPAAAAEPATLLLGPGESGQVVLDVPVPDEIDAATFRGALLLYGFRDGGVPVEVTIEAATRAAAKRAKAGGGKVKRVKSRRGAERAGDAAPAAEGTAGHAASQGKRQAAAKRKGKAAAKRKGKTAAKRKAAKRSGASADRSGSGRPEGGVS